MIIDYANTIRFATYNSKSRYELSKCNLTVKSKGISKKNVPSAGPDSLRDEPARFPQVFETSTSTTPIAIGAAVIYTFLLFCNDIRVLLQISNIWNTLHFFNMGSIDLAC